MNDCKWWEKKNQDREMVAWMVQNSNLMQHFMAKVFVRCKIIGGWFLFAAYHPFPNLLYYIVGEAYLIRANLGLSQARRCSVARLCCELV
jgi:hypothetical protein